MKLSVVLKILLLVLLGLSFVLTGILYFSDYQKVLLGLSSIIGRSEKIDFLRNIITLNKLRLILILFEVFILFTGLVMYMFIDKIIRKVFHYIVEFKYFIQYLISIINDNKQYFILLFLLMLAYGGYLMYYAFKLPISYDEAVTYLNFTRNGVLVSMSYYPAPNNHIFFSIITNFINTIGLFNEKIVLRLPSVLFSLIFIISMGIFLLKLIPNKLIVISNIIVCMCLYPYQLYSIQGRGYMIYMFFSLICFISIYGYLINSKHKWFFLKVFIVGNILGMYTIPSFLYSSFSLFLWGFIVLLKKRDLLTLKYLIYGGAIYCITTIILYLPVIFVSGLSALVSNKYVMPQNRLEILSGLLNYMKYYSSYFLWNWDYAYVVIILLLIVLFLFVKQNFIIVTGIALIFVLPAFIMVMHSVIPFSRTWLYVYPTLIIMLGFVISNIKCRYNEYVFLMLSVIIMVFGIISFKYFYRSNYIDDFISERLSIYCLSKDYKNFYFDNDTQEVLMCYNYNIHNKIYNVDRAFIKNDNDNTNKQKEYDVILITSKDKIHKFYSQKYFVSEDYLPYIVLFRR